MTLRRRSAYLSLVVLFAASVPAPAAASLLPQPLASLQLQLTTAAFHAPGRVGIAIEDLATGMTSGVNASANLPAASTIKIPVMVEVFKQMEAGTRALTDVVHLESHDRDWGSGDLAAARAGSPRTVKQLLWAMITQSDNTATNMLIRLVGRQNVNATMTGLGLHSTRLGADIRSDGNSIRYALRTSPSDMLVLLDAIARNKLVDEWSSREMLAILTGQTHNGLLPRPLPKDVKIAHKTGTLHDTLNDVGIVYRDDEPYVIAVMTTQLPTLDLGRAFIRNISRITYDSFSRFATWREDQGIAAFAARQLPVAVAPLVPLAPDERMWNVTPATRIVPPDPAAPSAEPD